MGGFVISPLPPVDEDIRCSKPLCSTGVTPLRRYYELGRRRLVVSRFPGVAGYTTDLLHRFLDGTRTVSPVAEHALVTVLPLTTPPEWQRRVSQPAACHAAFAPQQRARPPDVSFLSRPPLGSLMLRPGDSLTIPRMALSVGFVRGVSSVNGRNPRYGASDYYPRGTDSP
jgi:hypothetical protein